MTKKQRQDAARELELSATGYEAYASRVRVLGGRGSRLVERDHRERAKKCRKLMAALLKENKP